MNRTAVFVVLGFSGMILLAAAMVWFPPAGTKPAETGVRQPCSCCCSDGSSAGGPAVSDMAEAIFCAGGDC
jgi:hypothetical protein